ncbi:MAG: polyprenyl synthetase family protein [Candidatus Ranarchaeia archaeon]
MSQISFLKQYQEIIEREIPKYIPDKPKMENFYGAMRYAMSSGGKRIRPALCIACCQALDGKIEEALPFAIGVELIHNFSLVHDDIEDQDKTRRNLPSVWVKYGLAHGVNIGDGIFALAFQAVLKTPVKDKKKIQLLRLMTEAIIAIAEGQTIDIDFHGRSDVTESEYFDSVSRKTGYLLSTALKGGAIIADAPLKILEGLEQYGRGIGMAFQIRDDIIDLTQGKGRGGEIGCDIREGKRSLIAIHAINNANPKHKKIILAILDKPREKTLSEDVRTVIDIYKIYGSISYAQSIAEKLVNDAIKGLKRFPDTPYRKYLIELAKFIIERKD